ncbi:MAG: hydrogenase maturation protease [Planctomycetota bacterium]
MTDASPRVLVYGYGNPGRKDDGLGPALAERVAAAGPAGVTVETNYQLAVEDAAQVADHDVVIFADAAMEGPAPFTFRRVEPSSESCFTTHVLPPEVLMGIAAEHFGAEAAGYVLGIRGHEFDEFGEYLSERARDNLGAACVFLLDAIRSGRFEEAVMANANG